MRCQLTLAMLTAFLVSSIVPALAQAPAAAVNSRGAGVAGTAIGSAVGLKPTQVPLAVGTGHIGAGTGGTGLGVGNATGGIKDSPRAATGGILDTTSFGLDTGGIQGSGRGFGVGTGGINNRTDFGLNTGGIGDGGITAIGAGSGGRGDLNSLGAGTGGIIEQNAPRFRKVP